GREAAGHAYGAFTLCGGPFQTLELRCRLVTPMCPALQPHPDESGWFGLVRFRSPLLTESLLLSFPPGTAMCQFPGCATYAYGFSVRRYRESRPQRSFDSSAGL